MRFCRTLFFHCKHIVYVRRTIYNQPGQDPGASVNFFMVVLVALLGSSVVMGLPYLLQFKQSNGKSIAEIIESDRKRRGGHMN